MNAECNLRNPIIIYNLITTAYRSNREKSVELPGWGPEDWVIPGSCLAKVCGLKVNVYGGLDCVKTLAGQLKQLTILIESIKMKTRTETELTVDFHGGTEVNLVTAKGFYSKFGSSLNLE